MTKKFVFLTTTALLVLGLVMWQLGVRAQSELKHVATEQFNRQQLILAQKLAQDLEQHFQFLGSGLLELSNILHRHPGLLGLPEKALPPFQEILRQSEVLAIGYVPPGGASVTFYNEQGPMPGRLLLDEGPFLEWARSASGGKPLTGRVESPPRGAFAGQAIVRMAVRIPGEDAEAERPGVVFFVVDALAVARRYAHDVRSGQTGYAWVLDQRGHFLDHFEEDFIGKDAFSVRRQRGPDIDFSRIDQLMREKIMRGEEGTDWYVSGWHRGVKAEMRKLIAYAPARIAPDQPDPVVWGVALAAPVEEVEGIIGKVALREMFMVAVFQVVVFTGLAVTMYFAFRWSANLKAEVDSRTAELRDARDKIRRNLQTLLETQERLIRSERFAAVGEAAAHISHEIRNPLMLIGGFARQVRRSLPGEGKEAEKLRLIEEEARRLETMLEEVRDFTRPAAPKLAPRDLNATVWDTVTLMEQELASRGVTIRAALDKTLPPAVHDPAQIRQVVLNLVKNAAEAMPSGGAIEVASRLSGDSAEVVVKDNGPGMTDDEARLAFNPFYTTKERGTGLGLPVCERILQDHGGALRLESVKGKGCAFTMSLPVERRGPA